MSLTGEQRNQLWGILSEAAKGTILCPTCGHTHRDHYSSGIACIGAIHEKPIGKPCGCKHERNKIKKEYLAKLKKAYIQGVKYVQA